MDLRTEKTERSIINAFIELRAKKPLEKITVKELCQLARINKSTFYAHYSDIYELSDVLETQMVTAVIESLKPASLLFQEPGRFTAELTRAYCAQDHLIRILFSGSRSSRLVSKIHHSLLQLAAQEDPSFQTDIQRRIGLTYAIYGSYYAFMENQDCPQDELIEILSRFSQQTGLQLSGEEPLEKMGEFFDRRLDGYEEHQLTCIEDAQEFYPFTARCLPAGEGVRVLDLGCGTGLELNYYFQLCPSAHVTGIDLAPGMLAALKEKFPGKDLTLIQGSYFDVPFGGQPYDAAVSVESLHHFTREQKTALYRKVYRALKNGGCFVLTDYFSMSEEEEQKRRQELNRLKALQGITGEAFYHYDTPLTEEHERQALKEAGFPDVECAGRWGHTSVLIARKP